MLTLAPVRLRGTETRAPVARPVEAVGTEQLLASAPEPQVAPSSSGLLRHTLRHNVFAEFGCTHCSRSHQRAMLRYQH